MPMIDLTVPRGVLSEQAKAELMATLTRTLLKWEGAAFGNTAAESIAWSFVHEPTLVTVAGAPITEPRYRVVLGVPQATLSDEAKKGLVAEVTDRVLRAERDGAAYEERDTSRVWVIINEIPDGNWGGAGRIFRLADIMAFAKATTEDIAARAARLEGPAAVRREA